MATIQFNPEIPELEEIWHKFDTLTQDTITMEELNNLEKALLEAQKEHKFTTDGAFVLEALQSNAKREDPLASNMASLKVAWMY